MARQGYWSRFAWASTAVGTSHSAVMANIPVGYTLDRMVFGWQILGNVSNPPIMGVAGVWSVGIRPDTATFPPSQWYDQNAARTWLWWAGIRHHYETPTRAPAGSANLPTLWAGTPAQGIEMEAKRTPTEEEGALNVWWQWGWELEGGFPCWAWADVSAYILAPEGVTVTPEMQRSLHRPPVSEDPWTGSDSSVEPVGWDPAPTASDGWAA